MAEDTDDRPRGMLSPADRAFLRGEAEMTHEQSRRNAASRVRGRVGEAVRDFALLAHTFDGRDRANVFGAVDDPAFRDGLTAMLSVTYLGLKEQGVEFADLLEPAVRKAEEVYAADTLGSAAEVSVDFDVTASYGTSVADAAAKVRDGATVTPEELFSLTMTGDAALDDASRVLVQLPRDVDGERDDVVDRLAAYLDATVTERPLNRVALEI